MADEQPKRKRTLLYDEPLPHPNAAKAPIPVRPDHNRPTVQQEQFVMEYLANGRRGEAAARQVGVPATRAYGASQKWLRDPRVRRKLAEVELETLRRQNVDMDLVMRQMLVRATTPVTEALGEVIIPPCRHCWGTNNEYQRTHAEWEKDERKHDEDLAAWVRAGSKEKTKPLPFNPMGGDGYDPEAPPNPDCPNCYGRGDIRNPVHLPIDTRFMSAEGKLLLAGFEIGKDGYKLKTRDQDTATASLISVLKDVIQLRQRDDALGPILDVRPVGTAPGQIRRIERVVVSPKSRD